MIVRLPEPSKKRKRLLSQEYDWCSGRRGYTREEIAYKLNTSERTIDREYADAKSKILAIIEEYNQIDYKGDFFFNLDTKLTGYDWSKYDK